MRALLYPALLLLAGCASGLADPCEKDEDCESRFCLVTKSPKEEGADAVDVKFCVKPCSTDAECKDIGTKAVCRAQTLGGRAFCAEPIP
jgi:hypothetical protein